MSFSGGRGEPENRRAKYESAQRARRTGLSPVPGEVIIWPKAEVKAGKDKTAPVALRPLYGDRPNLTRPIGTTEVWRCPLKRAPERKLDGCGEG